MTKILILTGEASGDVHAAEVVKTLKQQQPDIEIAAIGGKHLKEAGAKIIFDANKIAVVGFIEVLKHFSDIRTAWRTAKEYLLNQKPDLVICVDYPGFNLRFAKLAKQHHTKVLYYISPQIWAWRQNRVYKIKKVIDHMAVIFPFEVPFYEKAGVPVTYVGSPLMDEVKSVCGQEHALRKLKIKTDAPVIGLVPGSRHSEISRLMPTLLQAAEQIQNHFPEAVFLLPIASTLNKADIQAYLTGCKLKHLKLMSEDSHLVIEACDAIVCSSGTVTLETAILGTPMVIVYKTAALTYQLAKRLVKIKNIGLCNIVAGKAIMPELIQNDVTAENISNLLLTWLHDKPRLQELRTELAQVKAKLGQGGAAKKVSKLVATLLKQ